MFWIEACVIGLMLSFYISSIVNILYYQRSKKSYLELRMKPVSPVFWAALKLVGATLVLITHSPARIAGYTILGAIVVTTGYHNFQNGTPIRSIFLSLLLILLITTATLQSRLL